MHIIIDATTTQDQFAYAGVGQYTKNIVLTLAKEFPSTNYSVLLFEEKDSTLDSEIKKYSNIEIVRVGKYKVNDYKNDITYYLQILPKVKNIRRNDSIFFSPYFWRNYPSDIMPTVLFVHDMNLPLFNMYSQQSAIHNEIRKIQYWLSMNKSLKCKYLICNSETTKNDYLKYYPKYPSENVFVSYLGISLKEEEYSLENILPKDYKERGYFIYLGGGINRNKNSEGVINGYVEFLKLLNKKNPPYLVIAGGKFQDRELKEVQELYEIIKKNSIEDDVFFTGFYPDESTYSLLHNALGFLHLSLYEGFGITVSEALRAKVPAILHKNPVYEELFKDVSLMVNGLDSKEVGKSIYDVYLNREKYTEMVEKGYELSKKYTWEDVARKTHKVFESINN